MWKNAMRLMTSSLLAALMLFTQQAAIAQSDAQQEGAEAQAERQKVLGLGGFFFRSENPRELAAWYERHLGINPVPTSYDIEPWRQEAGPTVFAPFPRGVQGMGNEGKEFVFNFRVADLDAMVAQLRADGIEVEVDPQTYPNGRFASLDDPEGNPIQLWQAMDPSEAEPASE